MSKQKITAADVAALAVSAARAAGGDVTGLVTQIPKWVKPAAVFAGSFLIIIAIIISSPLILLGKLLFPDTSTISGQFYQSELNNADIFIEQFMAGEQTRFQASEALARKAAAADADWISSSDIDIRISREELLILYSVICDDYSGQAADFSKLDNLSDSIIERSENLSSSQIQSVGSNRQIIYKTQYLFTYSARLKSFTQMLEALNLSDVQKDRAMVMYRYLYDQKQSAIPGNDISAVDLGNIVYSDGSVDVTYFNQKDSRWCDTAYGKTGTIGGSGCGPAALAIAISSLKGTTVLPTEVADWSAKNGYYVEGAGSLHALIPAGAKNWSITVKGVGYDWQAVVDALANGKLVIAIMGRGHFTSGGHFIVLRGVTSDGKILVADPNSVKRSGEQWDAGIIAGEARKDAAAGGAFWILSQKEH